MSFKSGFVTIVGRPNTGKSTLINQIIGEKLVIISDKPQTTRNVIRIILTDENSQLIFLDTPGIHKPRTKLGEYMVDIAKDTLKGVDAVVFLTDDFRGGYACVVFSYDIPQKQIMICADIDKSLDKLVADFNMYISAEKIYQFENHDFSSLS
jgi:GTP-binding protein Era